MKYIDSEKLIAGIERYENTAIDAYNPHGEDADFWHGKVVACEDLKTLVTSLQQEQDLIIINKKDWEAQESFRKNKKFGVPFPQKPFQIVNVRKMKQPVEELEEEIDKEWRKCSPIDEGMGVEIAWIHIEQFDLIARHFYELGLNARKNE